MENIDQSITKFLVLVALFFGTLSPSAYSSPTEFLSPEEVVEKYCEADFEGANTHTKSWKRQIQPLTTWADGPGWDSLMVVKKFTINEIKKSKSNAEIAVEYEIVGELNGHNFSSKNSKERIVYQLVNDKGSWKITVPQPPPHVSVSATLRLLEQSSVVDEVHRTNIQDSITQLKKQKN